MIRLTTAELEEWEESAILGETSQAKSVGDTRVHGGERVALDGSEGVSNVEDLLKRRNTRDSSSTESVGELLESSNLEGDLDLIDRLALAGHTDTKTVVGEGGEAVVLDRTVGVGVVVVVVGEVPVRAVEADTVGEKLNGIRGTVRWSAVGGGQVVASSEIGVLCIISTG